MDFQKQLHKLFIKHDEPKQARKQIEIEIKKVIEEVAKPTWMIRKRSLPVGVNYPILYHLTEEEANRWLQKLKPKLIVYNEDTNERVVYYYDKVRSDENQNDLYSNPKQLIIGEVA